IKEIHWRGQPVLVGTIAIEKSEKLSAQLKRSGFLPARLVELVRAAGLEGPGFEKWAAALAEKHSEVMAWLIQAGATISSIKKSLSGGKFKALAASPGAGSSDGLGRAFLESVMKRGIPGYVPRARPALDDGVAPVVIQFATSFDDEQAALIDYLIEAQCTPRRLAQVLDNREMEQNILNAKQHEREASIVAQAGRVGAVTISTNMAGRGTDILLGGNPEFMAREEFRKAPEKYRDQGINPEPPNSPPAGSPPEALKAYADEYSRWRENWEKFLARFRSVTDVE